MIARPAAAPPIGPLIGASFDRAITIMARSWQGFLIAAVVAIVGSAINVLIGGIALVAYSVFWYYASLANAIRLDKPEYRMNADMVLRIIGLSFVYGIAVELAALLLIIPGIYIGNKWSLAPVILVRENVGIGEALRRSWELTDPFFWPTLGFNILAGFAVVAVAVVGQLMAAGIIAVLPLTMWTHATTGTPAAPPSGLYGMVIALAYAVYLYAIIFTYQAKDVALLYWTDALSGTPA